MLLIKLKWVGPSFRDTGRTQRNGRTHDNTPTEQTRLEVLSMKSNNFGRINFSMLCDARRCS